jgi:hypothetical protein
LVDLTTRYPLPRERDWRTDEEIQISQKKNVTGFKLAPDLENGWEELRKLGDAMDIKKVTWWLLRKRLSFGINTLYRLTEDGSRRGRGNEGAYGRTHVSETGRIRIEVAAEMLWPLLSPHYTSAEKLTCSFSVAKTILHEIGVC